MSLAIIKTELQTDPLSLGYAPLLINAEDQAIANILNALTGPGTGIVNRNSVAKGEFLLHLVAPAAIALASKSSDIQQKWDRIIQIIIGSPDTINVSDPVTEALFSVALADGILSQPQIDSVSKQLGSRAQVLLGADTVLTKEDIAACR